MAYTPTLFTKGDRTKTAYSWSDHWNLIADGYVPGGALPPAPPSATSRLAAVESAVDSAELLIDGLSDALGDLDAAKADAAALTALSALNSKVLAAQGLPSYITGGPRSNPYDPRLNVYNFKPSNTRRLRAGLGRAMRGGRGEIVVVGDSGATGAVSNSSWDRPHSWPYQAGAELARHGIAKGGTGLVRVTDAGVSVDTRWSATGSWNAAGKWYSFTAANGATATFTSDFAGDRVTLLYYDLGDNATFTVSINGVSQGTVTCSGPAGLKSIVYTANIAVGQTVVLTKTSTAGAMDIVGVNVWNIANPGLQIHNLAQSGSTASGSGAAAWVDSSTTTALGSLIATSTKVTATGGNADCVIIGLGGNDMQAAVNASDATIKTAITTIRNRFPSSDAILVTETMLNPTLVSEARWETFLRMMYDLADELDIPLVDHRARLGNYATVVANGLSTDGAGHLLAGANSGLGRNLGQILAG